jgi:hypothetical protein
MGPDPDLLLNWNPDADLDFLDQNLTKKYRIFMTKNAVWAFDAQGDASPVSTHPERT